MSTEPTKKMRVPRPGTKARSLYDFLQSRTESGARDGANFRDCVHAYMRWETKRGGAYAEPFSCTTLTGLLKDFGHKLGVPGGKANWVFGPFPADGERVACPADGTQGLASRLDDGSIVVEWDSGFYQRASAKELCPEWLWKRAQRRMKQYRGAVMKNAATRKADGCLTDSHPANELATSAHAIPDAFVIHTTPHEDVEDDMLSPDYWL